MSYFKINNHDYSMYVSGLKISKDANYTAQTNAKGDTLVDYINSKRTIEVQIIPLDDKSITNLLTDIDKFNVSVSYRDPITKALVSGVNCIVPSNQVEYYTIRADKTSFKGFNIKLTEL